MADDILHPALQPAPEPAKPGGIFSGSIDAKPAEKAGSTGAEKLRAFEDRHLGKNAVRINGEVERGHGSAFALKMLESPELRREHAAIERLIDAEKHLAEAEGAVSTAKTAHESAKAAVAEAAKATDAKPEPVKAA